MSRSNTGIILALAVTLASATAASAQARRYATAPTPAGWSQLDYEHWALSHQNETQYRPGRTQTFARSFASAAPLFPGGRSYYETDPDPRIRFQLLREAPGKNW